MRWMVRFFWEYIPIKFKIKQNGHLFLNLNL